MILKSGVNNTNVALGGGKGGANTCKRARRMKFFFGWGWGFGDLKPQGKHKF